MERLISCFAPANKYGHRLENLFAATEKMREGFLVETNIKAHAPVSQHGNDQIPKDAPSADNTEVPVLHSEVNPILPSNRSIYELMLHRFQAHIHEFAVLEFREQQVVQQLRTVPVGQRFHSLKFKQRSAAEKQIQVVCLAETLKRYLNWLLDVRILETAGNLGLVNGLIEQTANLIMYGEYHVHDSVSRLSELLVAEPP
jgi:hypothetical protein